MRRQLDSKLWFWLNSKATLAARDNPGLLPLKITIDSRGVCVSLKGINIYSFFRPAFIRLSNRTIDEFYNRGGPSCNCKGQTIPNPFSCYISQSTCITYAKLRDHFYDCHLHGWIAILDHQNIFTFECIPPA